MPQHFNPHLENGGEKEIKISLNIPLREMNNVDNFLEENKDFLQEKEEDSEMPSDYDDEEDDTPSS